MATGVNIEETECMHDEIFDFLCSPCKNKGKNKEAEKYCVDCKDYYCSLCVNFHKDIPALTQHKILDTDQFQPVTGQAPPPIPTERCNKHSHHYVDMYCQNHDDVGCPTCMAVDHRSKDTKERLQAATRNLKQHQSSIESHKKQVLENKTKLLQRVKTVREQLSIRLDVLEQYSIIEIEETMKPDLDKIQDELQQLQTNEDLVLSATNNLAATSNNISQDFVNIKKSENIARKAEQFVAESKATELNEDINFEPEDILLSIHEMKSLGKVNKNAKQSEETVIKNASDSKTTATEDSFKAEDASKNEQTAKEYTQEHKEPAVQDTSELNVASKSPMYKIKRKKKCSVKIPSDLHIPSIYSVCLLHDGTIILADFNNKKLKHLETNNYTVFDSCNLPDQPWQVCAVNKQEVATSYSSSFGVHFVSLQPKMTKTRQIDLNHTCRGLAYADGNLFISDSTSVYIYTMSGKMLKQITKDESAWGMLYNFMKPALFSEINGVAVNDEGSKIYVADQVKGLIALDKIGRVIAKYNGLQLQCAGNVCVADNSNLLVAGFDSRNVLQFGPSCELVGEVLKTNKDDEKPLAICFDHQSSKIILTYMHQFEIDIYDLV